MKAMFVAVFSCPVDPLIKQAILVEARRSWPFTRLPREDIHFPYHAHFSSHNYDAGGFDNHDDHAQAVTDALALKADLCEWSKKYPSVTFAVVEVEIDREWTSGGYVCRDGVVTQRRTFEERLHDRPHAYDLLEHVHLMTKHCDPLSSRYFCNINDLKNEALAEMDAVREYAAVMERQLEETWNDYDNSAREHLQPGWDEELEDPFDYLDGFTKAVEGKRTWIQIALTQELRRSVLVSSYSLFEQRLVGFCKFLEGRREQVPILAGKDFDKAKWKGIFKARSYLEPLVSSAFFDASPHWKEILEHNKIRNWIIHNGREIVINRDSTDLVRIVANRSDIKIEDGVLELSKVICTNCTDSMRLFICELATKLPKV